MKRIKQFLLTVATVLGAYQSSQAQAGLEQDEISRNSVLERTARIQKVFEEQDTSARVLHKDQISQWANFPNWPNWNNWNNWPNWYNY